MTVVTIAIGCNRRESLLHLILFAGDFNLPEIDWDIYQSNDAYEDCFVNKLVDANFKPCIGFNTTK